MRRRQRLAEAPGAEDRTERLQADLAAATGRLPAVSELTPRPRPARIPLPRPAAHTPPPRPVARTPPPRRAVRTPRPRQAGRTPPAMATPRRADLLPREAIHMSPRAEVLLLRRANGKVSDVHDPKTGTDIHHGLNGNRAVSRSLPNHGRMFLRGAVRDMRNAGTTTTATISAVGLTTTTATSTTAITTAGGTGAGITTSMRRATSLLPVSMAGPITRGLRQLRLDGDGAGRRGSASTAASLRLTRYIPARRSG
jgi:hypothetical protein